MQLFYIYIYIYIYSNTSFFYQLLVDSMMIDTEFDRKNYNLQKCERILAETI
jgi:hypothetical protein